MKIKDGLKLKGKFVEIPGAGRNDFARFLFEEGFRVGVEVGVNQGEYGIILCKAKLKVYGVDCWENYDGYKRTGTYVSHYEQVGLYAPFDCCFIDANHTLPYVVADIFGWEKKVRRGGIISGHDYAVINFGENKTPRVYDGCHVKVAVNACVDIMKIPKLYVLGERGDKSKDKWRSWFFFKQ